MTSKARGRSKRLLENIHANVPKRLVREYKKLGCNQLSLAKQLGVNDFYVNRLLKDGVEPSNPDIRVKLFLPKKKVVKKLTPRQYRFLEVREIIIAMSNMTRQALRWKKRMAKQTRQDVLRK